MRGSDDDVLSPGEIGLLVDGLDDDVDFTWSLIHLGIRGNPPLADVPPSPEMVATAFRHLEVLVERGLISIGRVEYVDPRQPANSGGPVRHRAEPIATVRQRVEEACAAATDWADWAFSCWLVNTEAGDAVARQAAEAGA